MDRYTRSLLAVSILAAISIPIIINPGDKPVTFSLIDDSAAAGLDGALPATAFARIQKMNSLGQYNDVFFIGSGRALSVEVSQPGTYRVLKGETSEGSAFGVDITSADFAVAPPGELPPGDAGGNPAIDDSAPFPSAYTERTTLMDGVSAIDVITGISVERILDAPFIPGAFDPPFPPQLPETVSETFNLMHQGVAFAVKVALQLKFPLPSNGHAE